MFIHMATLNKCYFKKLSKKIVQTWYFKVLPNSLFGILKRVFDQLQLQIGFRSKTIIRCCCFYKCSISNVMVTGDIEALLYSKVHAVLECYKHNHCFIEPFQLLPHTGLDCGRFTHIMAFNNIKMPLSG